MICIAWCAFLHGVHSCMVCPCAVLLCSVLVRYPGAMSLCGVFALMALIKFIDWTASTGLHLLDYID